MTTFKAHEKQIADKTVDAYSRGRYSDRGWNGIIRSLLLAGANEAEVIWILESKHTRWAADAASKNHGATEADFARYANSPHVGSFDKLIRTARIEVAKTAARTGADLAGNCEGEDIAELIDLARTIRDENGTHSARAARILDRIAKGGR